jgi:hypothetical protein
MCEKCEELDRRIDRLQEASSRITDQLTLSGIALLIERYEAQKRTSSRVAVKILLD